MGLTLEQIGNVKKNACLLNLSSLDTTVTGIDGGEDTTLGEFVGAENKKQQNRGGLLPGA